MIKDDKIGHVLKRFRQENHLSKEDVVVRLEKDYHLKIAEKTVSNWESNQLPANFHKFLALCEIYKIHSLSETFIDDSSSRSDFTIYPEERDLIMAYRKATPIRRQSARFSLGLEEEDCE